MGQYDEFKSLVDAGINGDGSPNVRMLAMEEALRLLSASLTEGSEQIPSGLGDAATKGFHDEDDMGSNDAAACASQQSVKAYTDNEIVKALRRGQCLYVDAIHGSNTSGTRGREDKPYKTLVEAQEAAVAGDTIFAYPGSHVVGATAIYLGKDGVDWHFYPGAIVTTGSGTLRIFTDGGNDLAFNVSGRGEFTVDGTNSIALSITGESTVNFEAKLLAVNDASAGTGIYVSNAAAVLKARIDKTIGRDLDAPALDVRDGRVEVWGELEGVTWWAAEISGGEVDLYGPRITGSGGAEGGVSVSTSGTICRIWNTEFVNGGSTGSFVSANSGDVYLYNCSCLVPNGGSISGAGTHVYGGRWIDITMLAFEMYGCHVKHTTGGDAWRPPVDNAIISNCSIESVGGQCVDNATGFKKVKIEGATTFKPAPGKLAFTDQLGLLVDGIVELAQALDHTTTAVQYIDTHLATEADNVYTVDADIVGINAAGDEVHAYNIRAVFQNDGGTLTREVHTVTTVKEDDSDFDASLEVDTTNDTIKVGLVHASGSAGTIEWKAGLRVTRVAA